MRFDEYAKRLGQALSEAGKSASPPPLDQARSLQRRQRLLTATVAVVLVGVIGVTAFYVSTSRPDDGPISANTTTTSMPSPETTQPATETTQPVVGHIVEGADGVQVEMACEEIAMSFYDYTSEPFEGNTLDELAGTRFEIEERGIGDPPVLVDRDENGLVVEIKYLFFAENNTFAVENVMSCPSTQPDDVRVVELPGGAMRLTYPADWYLADERLTPNLGAPREIFSLGSFPLVPGGPNCAQIPSRALHDLGSTDVFLTVQERTVADPAGFDPRPEHFGPTPGDTDNVFYDCIEPGELADIGTLHWTSFTDQNRYFHMLVALGADAPAEKVSALWNSLDQLVIEPLSSRTLDAESLVDDFLASRVAGVGAESYLTPLGQQAFGLSGSGAHELAGLLYDESGRNFTKGEVVLIDEISASPTEPATWEVMVRLDVEQSDVGHRETLFVVSLSNGTLAVDGGRIGWEGP